VAEFDLSSGRFWVLPGAGVLISRPILVCGVSNPRDTKAHNPNHRYTEEGNDTRRTEAPIARYPYEILGDGGKDYNGAKADNRSNYSYSPPEDSVLPKRHRFLVKVLGKLVLPLVLVRFPVGGPF